MKKLKVGLVAALITIGLAVFSHTTALATVYPSTGDVLVFSNGPGLNNGGEFNVDVVGKGNAFDFITFCLEKNENLSFGDHYSVGAISEAAVLGGLGGSVGGQDPLDERTAYLYAKFTYGTLAGYDYSVAGREASATALQQAIWFIEEEGGASNSFVTLAENEIALGNWTGLGPVRVINLVNNAGENKQDVLTLIPEPSMMLLFGAGLVGLGLFRRKNS